MLKLLEISDDTPSLGADALAELGKLEGGVAVVVFIGDGRSGKSFLADRLAQKYGLQPGTFRSDSTQDAVTEGMDMVAITLHEKGTPPTTPSETDGNESEKEIVAEKQQDPSTPSNLVIVDCEGGTNAQAPIRQLVYVLGSLIASQCAFVVGSQASEAQLQSLGTTIAARQLINTGDESKLAAPTLHFVINKKDPTLKDQELEVLLKEQHDESRNRLRASIKDEYPDRHLHSIPFDMVPQFEPKCNALLDALSGAQSLTMSGTLVKGPQLVSIIETAFNQMQQYHHVRLIDVERHVIYDGFLVPLAFQLFTEFKNTLPDHSQFFKYLRDKREDFTAKFAEATTHVKHDALKQEATNWLAACMNEAWDVAVARNDEIGHQTYEIAIERKESLVRSYKHKIVGTRDRGHLVSLFMGRTKVIYQDRGVYQSYSRSRTVRKNGSVEYSEWMESGQNDREIKQMTGCMPFMNHRGPFH
eukprot:TRINITY_DN41027_c0_g1_i1.p1 TRINITY_DN41027_c0_g1~~TRINITY_DN41027_c0_g1_i1.p1  ORF type:complete len:473 (-),score=69.08 TRINITY_DN41027_c0_g1_i1:227-1645(-)